MQWEYAFLECEVVRNHAEWRYEGVTWTDMATAFHDMGHEGWECFFINSDGGGAAFKRIISPQIVYLNRLGDASQTKSHHTDD